MKNPASTPNAAGNGETLPPAIPDHELIRRIGGGSYGDVWLALNAMKKWSAVKLVYRRTDDDGRSFEQEFRGLRRYDDLSGSDASLMPIKNVGENKEAGFFYYAMELADDATTRAPLPRPDPEKAGLADLESLAASYKPWTLSEEMRKRGRLPPQECIEHTMALATALEQLHQASLVHRDIKPSNIIFVNGRPKLADVGLVAATDATLVSFAGTTGFVPLFGAGEVSGDIFALGKVLYLMATGQALGEFPKEAPNIEELNNQERRELAELQAVYDRACAPSPEDRQSSAGVLRDELELLRRNESVLRLRQLEEERVQVQIQREANRRRRWRNLGILLTISGVVSFTATAVFAYAWRLRTVHAATVATLDKIKLTRMLVREAGWSRNDWNQVQQAARLGLDDEIMQQAVSTLSGLDVEMVQKWEGFAGTSAAFSRDGQILLSGYQSTPASLITEETNRTDLPVTGEGKVCWATDGEPLVFQPGTNACLLREARSGNVRRSFGIATDETVRLAAGPVLAISSNGKFVAAGLHSDKGDKVAVWNAENGKLLGETASPATALAFTPDANLLGVGQADGSSLILRVSPFQAEATLPAAAGANPIQGLAFTEDRKFRQGTRPPGQHWLMATADLGAGVVIWDVTARIPRSFCRGSSYAVQSVAFHPDGLILASAGRMSVRFWDVMTGNPLLTNPEPGSSTWGLAFNARGDRLVAGANSKDQLAGIYVMRWNPGRGIMKLGGLTSQIRKVWFSADSRLVAALSDAWTVGVWETKRRVLTRLLEVPSGVYADSAGCALDTSGQFLAFSASRQACWVDLSSGLFRSHWPLPRGSGDQIRFEPDGRLSLARVESDPVQTNNACWVLYELHEGKAPIQRARQHQTNYSAISVGLPAMGQVMTVITHDLKTGFNSVRGISLADDKELWAKQTKHTEKWALARIDPSGVWGVFRSSDKGLLSRLVRLSDGHETAVFTAGCQAIGPTGRDYVRTQQGTHLELQNLDDPSSRLLLTLDGTIIGDTITFSPDGRLLAWGCTDGTVAVADLAEVRRRLKELGAPPANAPSK